MVDEFKIQNTKLKERYEELAKHYNDRLHLHIPEHKKILEPFINLLNSNFKDPKIIDLGCGVGLNSLILEENGFDVTGIDYSSNSIEHAKRNCSKSKFVHADFLDWYPENKFHGLVAGSFLDKFHPDLLPEVFEKIDFLLYPKAYGLVYMPLSKDEQEDNIHTPLRCKHINPYVALLKRDVWAQRLSEKFKVVNYYDGYGCRDWMVAIFQKL